eukprot:CAMPEP_0117741164 /NCGR_PEP_ID=MMETSP0947-20121206/4753_1 /TAXON_ID=44440 /ORGANISM="Chattonella subsalsa, Strain CCMP2191" /LENGTH=1651 /DNA_ID=CAMNT_0005557375 /DNA_START=1536 /DNA_END=6491 /DNA_ORIENTATION=-
MEQEKVVRMDYDEEFLENPSISEVGSTSWVTSRRKNSIALSRFSSFGTSYLSVAREKEPLTAGAGGRPFLQELEWDCDGELVTGDVRSLSWNPKHPRLLSVAHGLQLEGTYDSATMEQGEKKAFAVVWDTLARQTAMYSASMSMSNASSPKKGQFDSMETTEDIAQIYPEGMGAERQEFTPVPSTETEAQTPIMIHYFVSPSKAYPIGGPWSAGGWNSEGSMLALCCAEKHCGVVYTSLLSKNGDSFLMSNLQKLHDHHEGYITDVAFSRNGSWIATASDGKVVIFGLEYPKKFSYTINFGIFSISFAKAPFQYDGVETEILAIGTQDLSVKLCFIPRDIQKEEVRRRSVKDLLAVNKSVNQVGGKYKQTTHMLSRIGTQKELNPKEFSIHGHEGSVSCVAWHPSHLKLATGSWDNMVAVWDVSHAQEGHYDSLMLGGIGGHTRNVNAVSWDATGELLASASDDGTIIVWGVETATKVQVLSAHYAPVTCVQWHPHKGFRNILASGSSLHTKHTIVWDYRAIQKAERLHIPAIALNAQKYFNRRGRSLDSSTNPKEKDYRVSWSNTGTKLVFASFLEVLVWDMAGKTTLQEHFQTCNFTNAYPARFLVAEWVPSHGDDNILAVAVADNSRNPIQIFVHFYDANSHTIQTNAVIDIGVHAHRKEICAMSFSNNGRYLATGGLDEVVYIWRGYVRSSKSGQGQYLPPNKYLLPLCDHTDWVEALSWCPHEEKHEGTFQRSLYLASASNDSLVLVWKLLFEETRGFYGYTRLYKLVGHRGPVFTISWGLKGEYLASGSFDKTIAVWNFKKILVTEGQDIIEATDFKSCTIYGREDRKHRKNVKYLEGHKEEVHSLQWARDGTTLLASCSQDGTIIVWDGKEAKLRQVLKPHQPTLSGGIGKSSTVVLDLAYHPRLPRLASITALKDISIHYILPVPDLESQEITSMHLATSRVGRQILVDLVHADLLNLGTKDGTETLVARLLDCLGTCEDASYSRTLSTLLKTASDAGDFFYYCKFPEKKNFTKELRRRSSLMTVLRGSKRNLVITEKTSILRLAIDSNDVTAIKDVLQFITKGLTMTETNYSLLQSEARKGLVNDIIHLLQKYPDQASQFISDIGVTQAPACVLDGVGQIDLGINETLLLPSCMRNQKELWKNSYRAVQLRQSNLLQRTWTKLFGNDGQENMLHPPVTALTAGFDDCFNPKFLQKILNSSHREALFHAPIVRMIFEAKWHEYRRTWQLHLTLYLVYLLSLTAYILNMDSQGGRGSLFDRISLVFYSLAWYFFLLEIYQMKPWNIGGWKSGSSRYRASSVWNILDITMGILCIFFWHLERAVGPESPKVQSAGAVLAVCSWIKLLHFGLASHYMAALVETVLVILQDMVSFLFILLVFLLGFGVAFSALKCFDGDEDFGTVLLYGFEMVLGRFDSGQFLISSSPELAVICFACFQFIVTIVLLNALIAIMGNSFEKAQQQSKNNFHIQRALMVEELEESQWYKHIFCSGLLKKPESRGAARNHKYLHALVTQGNTYNIVSGEAVDTPLNDFQGESNKIATAIDKSLNNLRKVLAKQDKRLDNISRTFEDEISTVKEKIDCLELLLKKRPASATNSSIESSILLKKRPASAANSVDSSKLSVSVKRTSIPGSELFASSSRSEYS